MRVAVFGDKYLETEHAGDQHEGPALPSHRSINPTPAPKPFTLHCSSLRFRNSTSAQVVQERQKPSPPVREKIGGRILVGIRAREPCRRPVHFPCHPVQLSRRSLC